MPQTGPTGVHLARNNERARILDAAYELIRDYQHFADLPAEHIMQMASVTPAVFEAHFATKAELLLTLAADRLTPIILEVDEQFSNTPSDPDAVRSTIGLFVGFISANAPLFAAVFETAEHDPSVARFLRVVTDQIIDGVAGRIAREQAKGTALPMAPRPVATLLAGMARAAFFELVHDQIGMSDDELVEALSTVWIRAIYRPEVYPERG